MYRMYFDPIHPYFVLPTLPGSYQPISLPTCPLLSLLFIAGHLVSANECGAGYPRGHGQPTVGDIHKERGFFFLY